MQSSRKETGGTLPCDFLNFSQLSEWLGMSQKFLRKHNDQGRIPGRIRMGSRWMFKKEAIEKQMIDHGQLLLEEVSYERI